MQYKPIEPSEWHTKICDEYLKEITAITLPRKDRHRPCALFHYTGLLRERINDVVLVLNRMDVNRKQLLSLDKKLHVLRIRNERYSSGVTLPQPMQAIMQQEDRISKELRLDFEVLYVWGVMLLDQWALVAKCVGGIRIKKRHPFNEIMEMLEVGKGGKLQPIWAETSATMLWLFHNFRVFRNTFVNHAVDTWQRGCSRGIGTMDFRMFIPAPPGHRIDENQFRPKVCLLAKCAPKSIKTALNGVMETFGPQKALEIMIDKIGDFPAKKDRLLVEGLYKKFGGSTPTYQTVGDRLIRFCEIGLKKTIEIAKSHPEMLDLEYVDNGTEGAEF